MLLYLNLFGYTCPVNVASLTWSLVHSYKKYTSYLFHSALSTSQCSTWRTYVCTWFLKIAWKSSGTHIFSFTLNLIGISLAGVPPPSHRIIIPVKSLKVVGFAYDFFPYITCPALDELVYDVRDLRRANPIIIHFLEGSGRLRSFSMLNFIAISPFMSLLRAIPSVNKLALQIAPSKCLSKITSQPILEVLAMTQFSQGNPSQLSFLPHLETFEYTGPPFLPIPNIISPDPSPPSDNSHRVLSSQLKSTFTQQFTYQTTLFPSSWGWESEA